MAVKFSPDGNLDVATDPSQLPATVGDGDESSGAMVRCTNLQLDRQGIASTRDGSSKVNTSAMSETTPNLVIEQEGKRYAFTDTNIYENETSIKSGLINSDWSAVKYNAFNSNIMSIFGLNGTDRKRITSGEVHEWGSNAPEDIPVVSAGGKTGLSGSFNAQYTYIRKEGDTIVSESNPSDEGSADVTLSNQSLQIKIEPAIDPQINGIKVYRTDSLGINYYYLSTINTPSSGYDYSYCHDWEEADAYITGDGFQITKEIPDSGGQIDIHDCESLADITGTWTHSQSPSDISIDNIIYKTGIGSVKADMNNSRYIKFTKASGSWDLSGYTQIKAWLYAPDARNGVMLYFGESAYNEQSTGPFSVVAGWQQVTWDISAISDSDKDNMTIFAVGIDASTAFTGCQMRVDSPFCDAGGSYTTFRKLYSWEPVATTSESSTIKTYYWEPIIIDDNTADSSLGTEVPTNHDRPPYGTFVFGPSYTGMLFILKDNLMYYSLEKQPEYWPTEYYLEISNKNFPCKAGCIYDGQIYVGTTSDIYMVPGTSHESFSSPLNMSSITGTISSKCFLPVHGQGIFHLGNDGIYLMSSKDENITNSRFKPIWEGVTVGSIPGIDKTNLQNSWMIYFKNKFYFGYPGLGSTYPDNIMVTDLTTGKAFHYDYGQTFRCVTIDYTNNRLLAADTSGYIWELEDADVTTDNAVAIAWQIESKEYSDQLRKYFPRWARYDVALGIGATANGYILMNGVSQQTHALTISRKTKKRLITGCTGDRIAIRVTGTGPVDFYACEVE